MTMRSMFTVNEKIWERYPGMKLVCIAGRGLDNQTPRPDIDEMFLSAQRTAFEMLRGIDEESYPPFELWRRQQPGPQFPAAHEALARRAMSCASLRSVSPFVDFYNAICLDLLCRDIAAPIGAWSTDVLPSIRLGITAGGEKFRQLGKSATQIVAPQETAYTTEDGSELVTRHFVWRQSQLGAISSSTSSFFLVSELIEPFSEHAESIRVEIVDLVAKYFGIDCQSAILDGSDAQLSWSVAA